MAKRTNFAEIEGFQFFPEGKLLNQVVDFDRPFGVAYERCIGYEKSKHSHDRITITFPRGSSRSFIKTFPGLTRYNLNIENFHIMAKDHEHEQGSVTTIYDTFALFIDLDFYRDHLGKYGASQSSMNSFFQQTKTISRSAILSEAIERYFVARIMHGLSKPSLEMNHLESVLLNEIFVLSGEVEINKNESTSSNLIDSRLSLPLSRSIEFIEAHLFEKLDVVALSSFAKISQATLFRLFSKNLRLSPIEYVRQRRLDEAQALLKTGHYEVGDVALLVGYEDLSTFSKAFRARFKISPSKLLPGKTKVT